MFSYRAYSAYSAQKYILKFNKNKDESSLRAV